MEPRKGDEVKEPVSYSMMRLEQDAGLWTERLNGRKQNATRPSRILSLRVRAHRLEHNRFANDCQWKRVSNCGAGVQARDGHGSLGDGQRCRKGRVGREIKLFFVQKVYRVCVRR